jgi:hypothetical protein
MVGPRLPEENAMTRQAVVIGLLALGIAVVCLLYYVIP